MKYSIPYGNRSMDFEIHTNRVLFSGEMTNIPPVSDFKEELIRSLDAPIASQSLASLAKGKKIFCSLLRTIREIPRWRRYCRSSPAILRTPASRKAP